MPFLPLWCSITARPNSNPSRSPKSHFLVELAAKPVSLVDTQLGCCRTQLTYPFRLSSHYRIDCLDNPILTLPSGPRQPRVGFSLSATGRFWITWWSSAPSAISLPIHHRATTSKEATLARPTQGHQCCSSKRVVKGFFKINNRKASSLSCIYGRQ